MVKRIVLPTLLVCCCLTSAVFATEPNDYLIPGKSDMVDCNLSGLRQAYQTFDAGLKDPSCSQCSTNRELKFLHAVTRTAMLFIDNNDLSIQDSFLEVAEKFGVQVLGDFFEELDVNVPLTNDRYKIPGGAPDPNEISNIVHNWITEINDIIADLNSISDSPSDRFRFFFEPNDTGLETPLEVDYGEVMIFKGLLLAFKSVLESKLAYDVFLDVDQSLLYNLLYVDGIGSNDVNSPEILHLLYIDVTDPNQLSINNDFLKPYPNLLKVLPTSGHTDDGDAILAQAARDWVAAINYYFDALDYIQSENNPPGTDTQEDELLYIDPNNQFFLNVVENRLTALRDSRLNDTTMVYPVETTKTYNVYNSTPTLIGQLVLKYDLTGISGSEGSLTFTASGIPSPWEIYNIGTGYGPEPLRPEIDVELECYAGGKWYDGYFDATLSQDGTSFDNGTFEYWGYDYDDINGLSGQLTGTPSVVNGKINLNPIFGGTPNYPDPVNPRDLLPQFDQNNVPIAGTFGHGIGNDPMLGGIFPDMNQIDWATLFDLPPPPDLPDLAGESVSSTLPVPSVPADKGKVSVVIANQGQGVAKGKINIGFYASLDQILDPNDILLATLANQSVNLAGDGSKTYTASVQIPPNVEAGDYYILANIDSTTIAESDEENNLKASDNPYEIVWKFGSFNSRTNVKLIVNDSNEKLVAFALKGGYGEIIGGPDFNQVVLNNTTGKSSLVITTKGKGVGTSVGDIIANGPLKAITAKTTDLRGIITVDGSLSSLTLDDVAEGHTITIGPRLDPKVKVTMKFDAVRDLAISSETPIKSIKATNWLNTDGTPDQINVPSLDALNITGNKSGIIGDFAGSLTVANNAGSLKIAGTLKSPLTIGGNVNSVTLNQLQGNLTIARNAKIIKVNQTLYTSLPPSGTYYTLHIGGAATVKYVQAGKWKTIKFTAGGDLYAY